jgi:hypothetical protein
MARCRDRGARPNKRATIRPAPTSRRRHSTPHRQRDVGALAHVRFSAAQRAQHRDTVLGMTCHSDDSLFTSIRNGERLAKIGAPPSIGTVGHSYDVARRAPHLQGHDSVHCESTTSIMATAGDPNRASSIRSRHCPAPGRADPTRHPSREQMLQLRRAERCTERVLIASIMTQRFGFDLTPGHSVEM